MSEVLPSGGQNMPKIHVCQCGHKTVETVGSFIDGAWYCFDCAQNKRNAAPTSNTCSCPNSSYGVKHTSACYERQIERLTAANAQLQAHGAEMWAEVKLLRADASRYRVLRDHTTPKTLFDSFVRHAKHPGDWRDVPATMSASEKVDELCDTQLTHETGVKL